MRFAGQCIEFAASMGFSEFIGMARVARGWATARAGADAAGLDDLDEGIRAWRSTGFENWQAWFALLRVELLGELGRRDEALGEIELQLGRIAHSGERLFESLLLAQKAALLDAAGISNAAAAGSLYDRAIEIASSQGAEAWVRRIERLDGRRAALSV